MSDANKYMKHTEHVIDNRETSIAVIDDLF